MQKLRILETERRFRKDEVITDKQKATSVKDIVDILMPQMGDLKTKVFKVVDLDSNNQILDILNTTIGTVDQANPIIREIIHSALQKFAASIICVRNHQSGETLPSNEDIIFAKELSQAGKIMQGKVMKMISFQCYSSGYWKKMSHGKKIPKILHPNRYAGKRKNKWKIEKYIHQKINRQTEGAIRFQE